jgi:hypothetical protein
VTRVISAIDLLDDGLFDKGDGMRHRIIPLAFKNRGPKEAGRGNDVLEWHPKVLEHVVRLPVVRSRGRRWALLVPAWRRVRLLPLLLRRAPIGLCVVASLSVSGDRRVLVSEDLVEGGRAVASLESRGAPAPVLRDGIGGGEVDAEPVSLRVLPILFSLKRATDRLEILRRGGGDGRG